MKYKEFFEYSDETSKSKWTKLVFGRHEGQTLPQIMFTDPGWFFWAHMNKTFKGKMANEAHLIYARSTNIRIPQPPNEEWIAEYAFDLKSGKLCDVTLVPKDHPNFVRSRFTMRKPVLDMGIPFAVSGYDKLGNKILVDAIRGYVVGREVRKMTKERCEAFFDDLTNFVAAD